MTPPIFHPLAEDELFEAMVRYEVVLGRARRKTLQQFPYNIVYSIDPSGIFVLAIAQPIRSEEVIIGRIASEVWVTNTRRRVPSGGPARAALKEAKFDPHPRPP